MITLRKLQPPENQTLFADHPELNLIWEIPALQDEARESYEQWGTAADNPSTGEIFSINKSATAIGIIGWFEYGEFPDVLRLRYYGIVPSQRGKRYGHFALAHFLQHLSLHAPQQYVWLSESVTLSRASAPRVVAHFKDLGFNEFDDPHYGSNAGCGKAQSLRIRIPER